MIFSLCLTMLKELKIAKIMQPVVSLLSSKYGKYEMNLVVYN